MSISRKDLSELLLDYDLRKGPIKRTFGDPTGIKSLRHFVNNLDKKPGYLLKSEEIAQLESLLLTRYNRIKNSSRGYRIDKQKLTNIIFSKLAKLIAQDNPKILAFAQLYQNDRTLSGKELYEVKEDLFVFTDKYALPLSEIKNHIETTGTLSHPIPVSNFRDKLNNLPLKDEDILALNESNPAVAKAISDAQVDIKSCRNDTILDGTPLTMVPKKDRFLTEDHFCLTHDEIQKIFVNQKRIYNPYTHQKYSKKDQERLFDLSFFQKVHRKIEEKQALCARQISPETLIKLKAFAIGLLNKHEITYTSEKTPTRAQCQYELFNKYYQELEEKERNALNHYWIDGWEDISVYIPSWREYGTIYGKKATTFESLYKSVGSSCVHSVGCTIVKMIFQLDPLAKFEVDSSSVASDLIQKLCPNMDRHRPISSSPI
jgi:hypothetical protein